MFRSLFDFFGAASWAAALIDTDEQIREWTQPLLNSPSEVSADWTPDTLAIYLSP